MNDLNVIDRFMQTFIRYIDSGFGLLGGDVGFLTTVLIGIDITLAGLFWALGGEQDVIGRFIKKILYVGAFAFILNQFSTLADIIFRSFAAAGLTAGGGAMSPEDLLKPGRLAGTGFAAAWPLLDQVSSVMGFTTFFDNFLTIAVLLFAWVLVILAFFILSIQMFVTIMIVRGLLRRFARDDLPSSTATMYFACATATVRLLCSAASNSAFLGSIPASNCLLKPPAQARAAAIEYTGNAPRQRLKIDLLPAIRLRKCHTG